MDWQPSASLQHLKTRAQILSKIRSFFAARKVLEVETPLLAHTSVTDPFIESIPAIFKSSSQGIEKRYYLQTSPEYAMKRLLAAGSGPIYQITKAFRQGEVGRLHNPEFTMLEWYQPGYDHHQLMDEVEAFLSFVMQTPAAIRKTYQAAFEECLNINPHSATLHELKTCASEHELIINADIEDKDIWLDVLMTHCVEPGFPKDIPLILYDFPSSQAALARILPQSPPVAARFEVFLNGAELANGFYELQDPKEQRQRFEANLISRKKLGLAPMAIDENLLSALEAGLPACAGVALGVDRLMLSVTGSKKLADVISFDFSRT